MTKHENAVDILTLTAEIVSAHLSNNPVSADDIPSIIEKVYKTLSNVDNEKAALPDKPKPAVPVKKSVTRDYIICLEDGKKLKMLRRYLKVTYKMTPEEYRQRWDLPPEYPMVAPHYAEQRSALAKQIGLGTQGRRKKAGERKVAEKKKGTGKRGRPRKNPAPLTA